MNEKEMVVKLAQALKDAVTYIKIIGAPRSSAYKALMDDAAPLLEEAKKRKQLGCAMWAEYDK